MAYLYGNYSLKQVEIKKEIQVGIQRHWKWQILSISYALQSGKLKG